MVSFLFHFVATTTPYVVCKMRVLEIVVAKSSIL